MKKFAFLAIILTIAFLATAVVPASAQLYPQFGRSNSSHVTLGVVSNYYGGYYTGYPAGPGYDQWSSNGHWTGQYYEGYPFYGDSIYYQARWIQRMEYMRMMRMLRMQQHERRVLRMRRRYGYDYNYGR
jgi:hypothetical protein